MPEPLPATHTTTAVEMDATAEGLAERRRRARGWVWAGLAAVIVGLSVGPAADEAGVGWVSDVAVACVGGGPVAVVVGMVALINCRRMRRALTRRPWIACPAVTVPTRQGAPRVVLRDPVGDGLVLLSVRTVQQRHHLASPGRNGVLWWCGDARTGGVLAQPGGAHLLWARPVHTDRTRRDELKIAEQRGLLHRPTPVQPQTALSDELDRPQEPDLTYGTMAEAAYRQAIPEEKGAGPRHEADIRVVPWWRVRSLLEISQLWPTVLNAAFAIGMTVAWWLLGRDPVISMPLIFAALSAFNALRFGHRMLDGIPAVKALALAARAPVPVPKRYVLLPGPDDGFVLVLFPARGGPDDAPEAFMEVNPPGTPKHPTHGMPPPAGAAELHGWQDSGPTVVPWIEGRPLWPRHQYETVNLNNPQDRDHLAALVGGGGADT
ncbi:hypothetical protein [Streptomyces sp. NPDC048411]|uniref:hypothetical protein n=1 Tax=Streptomyces sp. NPDC048411 TaxID=3157206 RepID=UPI0034538EF9